MSRSRMCPSCRVLIPIDSGFRFDEDLNIICGSCGDVAYPAVESAENAASTHRTTGGHSHAPPPPPAVNNYRASPGVRTYTPPIGRHSSALLAGD